MKFMVMHYSSDENEKGKPPTPELMEAMGGLMARSAQKGILLAGEGVHPMTKGARITYKGGKRTVKDGPFAEAKEVIAGFAIIEVASREEAIEFCNEFAEIIGDIQIDVRQVFEASDFGAEFTPELQEQETQSREQAAKNG